MYSASSKNNRVKRYFDITLTTEDGKEIQLSVLPPSRKSMMEIMKLGTTELANNEDEKSKKKIETKEDIEELMQTYSEMSAVASKIVSRNKQKIKITQDKIDEVFDDTEIVEFLGDITDWVADVKEHDPN